MFGVDAIGNTYARRLVSKSNSQRKLPGPVTLAVNDKALSPADIRIVWNNSGVSSEEQLKQLLSLIDATESFSETDVESDHTLRALAA
jgi:hypothetical protein